MLTLASLKEAFKKLFNFVKFYIKLLLGVTSGSIVNSKTTCEPSDAITASSTLIQMNQVIHSEHVNKCSVLDGGQLLKWVDICACLSAERLAGRPCVTVSVDDLHFECEVNIGQVITLKALVNRTFNTSMEVGVKVICGDLDKATGQKTVCDAFMTFVALDTSGKKIRLPQLLCSSSEQNLCYSLASERRKVRISYSKTLKSLLSNYKLNSLLSPSEKTQDDFFQEIVDGEATRVQSVELVLPSHANHHGNTFGGQIMAWMENVASISAGRLLLGVASLRSVDMVYFRGPSTVGDRVVLNSIVNNVFRDSLEVGVRVEAYRYENGFIGSSRHINSAFFTYDIPSDAHVPEYIPEAMDGERRQREAAARRKMRLDRRYILSKRRQDRLSVTWNDVNAVFLCYGNIQYLQRLAAFNDWQTVSTTDTMLLCIREEDDVLSFKATLKMAEKYKAEKIFEILKDPRKRAKWDPIMISCRLVKKVSDEDSLYHSVMHSKAEASALPNDFVLLVSDRRPSSDNEPYRVAIRSVTLDQIPPTDLCSRTEVACAGFMILQEDGICTEVVYYNETNPKLVSYVTCDVAGLSGLYSHVLGCMQNYFNKRSAELK
ncbi:acetyl-coenzyme A thioesterase-like isoform X1 [Clavelina lepadiformis]|uniref:Acyl-coenzyme A thioesterase 11 n=2 Tax=Clavelina lepadiformis TaxID=159417 RepID=A0ABP0GCW6_CLALP